jgi:tetratricopeptide (TPR) repeat protein/outer membrane protein assembly factor BamB
LRLALLVALAIPAFANGERADDWRPEARGDAAVLTRFKRMLEADPGRDFALKRLIDGLGLTPLLAEYEAKVKAAPDHFALRVILGRLEQRAGRTENALASLRAATKQRPDSFLARRLLAEVIADSSADSSDEAVRAFEAALEVAKKKDEKRLCFKRLAALAVRGRDIAKALGYWRSLVDLEPGNIFAREELAQTLSSHGLHDEALREWKAILAARRGDTAKTAETLREIGRIEEAAGAWEAAVATYRRALALVVPKHWLARELRERIRSTYKQQGKLALLEALYEKRKAPDDQAELARIREALGKENEAIVAWRAVIKERPGEPTPRLALVRLLENAQRWKEALAEWDELARRFVNEPSHAQSRALLLERMRDKARALAAWRALASRATRDPSLLSQAADAFVRLAAPADAISTLRRLASLEPRDPEPLRKLGDAFFRQGKPREAETEWRRAVALFRDRADGLAELARIFRSHELADRALSVLEEAARLSPENANVAEDLAQSYVRTRDLAGAVRMFERVLAVSSSPPQRARARTQLVELLRDQGTLAEAIGTVEKNLKANPKDRDAWRFLAELYQKSQRPDRAEEIWAKLIASDPKDIQSMLDLEQSLESRGETDRAIEMLRTAIAAAPRRAKPLTRRLIETLQRAGKNDAADQAARSLARGFPDDAEVQSVAGAVALASGRATEAQKFFRRALALMPDHAPYAIGLADALSAGNNARGAVTALVDFIREAKTEAQILDPLKRALRIAQASGAMADLESALEAIVRKNPNGFPQRLALAEVYKQFGKSDAFTALIQSAAKGSTSAPRALELLAERAREAGDTTAAIAHLRELTRSPLAPAKLAHFKALAELHFERGETAAAEATVREMVSRAQDPASAWRTAAVLFRKFGMLLQATHALEKQVETNPNDLAARLELARTLIRAEQMAAAERHLKFVVERSPAPRVDLGSPIDPAALLGLARSSATLSPTAHSPTPASSLSAAASREPRREALSLLVSLYERRGDSEALVRSLERRAKAAKDRVRVVIDLVTIFRERGQDDRAIQLLEKTLTEDKREPLWRILLAEIVRERGASERSARLYESAEALDSSRLRDFRLRRVQLLLEAGRGELALDAALDFLAREPGATGFAAKVADAFAERGDVQRGAKFLDRVIAAGRDPSSVAWAALRPHRVRLYTATGRYADAARAVSESMNEESLRSPADPSRVYLRREKSVAQLIKLLDPRGLASFIASSEARLKKNPVDLYPNLDLHLVGKLTQNTNLETAPLPRLIVLLPRDRALLRVAIERLIAEQRHAELSRALTQLRDKATDTGLRRLFAQSILAEIARFGWNPGNPLAGALIADLLAGLPSVSDLRTAIDALTAWRDMSRAIELAERARAMAPSDPSLYEVLARLYERAGQREKAREVFRKSLDLGLAVPHRATSAARDRFAAAHIRVRQELLLYSRAGLIADYVKRLTDRHKKDPDNPTTAYDLAALHTIRGNRGHALNVLEGLARARPTDPEAVTVLADRYRERFNYHTAIELYERALSLAGAPRKPILESLLRCYEATRNRRRAAIVGRELALQWGDVHALRRLVGDLRTSGRVDEAVKAQRRLLSRTLASRYPDPRTLQIRVDLELSDFLLVDLGQIARALSLLDRVIERVAILSPESEERKDVVRKAVYHWWSQNLLEKKIAHFLEEAKRHPRDTFPHEVLYQIAIRRGDSPARIQALSTIIALRPGDARAVRELAAFHAGRGEIARALEYLERLSGMSSDVNSLRDLGALYLRLQKTAEAKQAWTRMVERQYPFVSGLQARVNRAFALAEIFDQHGLTADAEAAFLEGLAASPVIDISRLDRVFRFYRARRRPVDALRLAAREFARAANRSLQYGIMERLVPYGYTAIAEIRTLSDLVERNAIPAPNPLFVYLFHGTVATRLSYLGRTEQATAAFVKAFEKGNGTEFLTNLQDLIRRPGSSPALVDLYERVVEQNASNPSLLISAGDFFMRLKRNDTAMRFFRRAAERSMSAATIQHFVGLLDQNGRDDEADDVLLRALTRLRSDITLAERIEERCRTRRHKNQGKLLEAAYRTLELHDATPTAELPRFAEWFVRAGRLGDAAEAMRRALAVSTVGAASNRAMRLRLVEILRRAGNEALANESFLEELGLGTARAKRRLDLARSLAQQGLRELAARELERAAFLAPSDRAIALAAAEEALALADSAAAERIVAIATRASPIPPRERDAWSAHLKAARPQDAPVRAVRHLRLDDGCTQFLALRKLFVHFDCAAARIVGRAGVTGNVAWSVPLPRLPLAIERKSLTVKWRYRPVSIEAVTTGATPSAIIVVANIEQHEIVAGLATGRVAGFVVQRINVAAAPSRARATRLVWERTISGDHATGAAIAESSIAVVGSITRLLNLETGEVLARRASGGWRYGWLFGNRGATTPVTIAHPDGARFVLGGPSGRLLAIDAKTHQIVWSTKLDEAILSVVVDGSALGPPTTVSQPSARPRVFVTTRNRQLLALDGDGRIVWRRAADVRFAPLVTRALLVAAERNGRVIAVDQTTGKLAWATRLPTEPTGAPVPALDAVAIPGAGNTLTILDLNGSIRATRRHDSVGTAAIPLDATRFLEPVVRLDGGTHYAERRWGSSDVPKLLAAARQIHASQTPELEADYLRAIVDTTLSEHRDICLRLANLVQKTADKAELLRWASCYYQLSPRGKDRVEKLLDLFAGQPGPRDTAQNRKLHEKLVAMRARIESSSAEAYAPLDAVLLALVLKDKAAKDSQIEEAILRLERTGSVAAHVDLWAIAKSHERPAIRTAALRAWLRTGEHRSRDEIQTRLRSTDPADRADSLAALEPDLTRDDSALIRPLLADPDPVIRARAARVMARFADPARPETAEERSVLRQTALNLPPMERVLAALHLHRLGDAGGLGILRWLYANATLPVRVRAAEALWEAGDPVGLSTLIQDRRGRDGSSSLTSMRIALGNLYAFAHDTRSAELEYRSAIQFDPKFEKPYFLLGLLRLRAGRFDEARELFDDALKRNDAFAPAELYAGLAELRRGNVKAAERRVKAAMELDPELSDAPGIALLVRAEKSDLADVTRAARELVSREPTVNNHLVVARVLLHRRLKEAHDARGATTHLDAAMALRAKDPEVAIRVAKIWDEAGDRARARAAWIRALELLPESASDEREQIRAHLGAIGRP